MSKAVNDGTDGLLLLQSKMGSRPCGDTIASFPARYKAIPIRSAASAHPWGESTLFAHGLTRQQILSNHVLIVMASIQCRDRCSA